MALKKLWFIVLNPRNTRSQRGTISPSRLFHLGLDGFKRKWYFYKQSQQNVDTIKFSPSNSCRGCSQHVLMTQERLNPEDQIWRRRDGSEAPGTDRNQSRGSRGGARPGINPRSGALMGGWKSREDGVVAGGRPAWTSYQSLPYRRVHGEIDKCLCGRWNHGGDERVRR